jgi:hypothetical protein
MNTWTVIVWTIILVICGPLALYGLHRLGLWMEEQGYIYYWHKKPKGSAAGSFVALQKMIEPRAEHVIQVTRADHKLGAEKTSGQGDPDRSSQ